MFHLASLLDRLTRLLVPMERRPDPIPVPIRHDDWRGPHRGDRRF